ncbi:MAG: hypothetical protein A2V93_05685 [Ignavibacteria bacterium RBG_16_34_14]|nr:MAG: hypothetical protein A2V93_05685 [Ignavibacteria bacterium RBG_16_34_14]
MERISLETFFSAETDLEINQYRILGGIKELSTAFDKKKIYPALAFLIELKSSLEQIREEKRSLSGKFPKQITGFDIKQKKIIFTVQEHSCNYKNIDHVFELIDWALPFIKSSIDEGIVLFDFVEKNITLEHVGILPMYKDEGYFMINDNTAFELQVHRYECSLFSSGKEKYRALKTEFVKSETLKIIKRTPESIKHELIKERQDLPNPATFICDTDLDFPFSETIFPVAKRKLMSAIAS